LTKYNCNKAKDQIIVKYGLCGEMIQYSEEENSKSIEKKIITRCRICGRRITITWRKDNERWRIVKKDPSSAFYDEGNYGWVCSEKCKNIRPVI